MGAGVWKARMRQQTEEFESQSCTQGSRDNHPWQDPVARRVQ